MGIWIRTKDRQTIVELTEVKLNITYQNTEIVGKRINGLDKHLRIL